MPRIMAENPALNRRQIAALLGCSEQTVDRFYGDSISHLSYMLTSAASALRFDFHSSLFEGKGTEDESWGLDNVRLRVGNNGAS
ncbi:MAG: hypothetical protein JO250_12585 [Armatimonadetes bacterium]|nr:hypothetical protein [Armatimonadota bacterium]